MYATELLYIVMYIKNYKNKCYFIQNSCKNVNQIWDIQVIVMYCIGILWRCVQPGGGGGTLDLKRRGGAKDFWGFEIFLLPYMY